MDVRSIDRVEPFITKDGSEIRELLAHRNSCIRNQTLAEARLPRGASTTPHRHVRTEEIYYILSGGGVMRVGDEIQSGRGRRRDRHSARRGPPDHEHRLGRAEVLVLLCPRLRA